MLRHLLAVPVAVALATGGYAVALPAAPAAADTCSSSIEGPNDPNFAAAERNPGSPTTWNAEQWYLYDCMPQTAPLATDPEGAAGMSVNKAWASYGMGSKQVLVAYMEGGVNWRLDDSKDLRRKAFLNTGELPLPEDSTGHTHPSAALGGYDLDGDGVVTVDDYKDDPRVHKPLLHAATAGGITAEDLIVSFSNGRDDDHNGYVDDISGWNFHRDTNDPQTDQSIYHHANGESENLAAEANNNFLGAGVCPNCRLLSVKMGDEAIDRPDRVAEGIVFAVDSGARVVDVTSASLGQTPSMEKAVEYAYRHGTVIVWASNDFESSDHTEGMRFPHVWPGNSVVSDQSNRSNASRPNDVTATTFRSRSTLTSYGAHALFSVSTDDGSTSAAIPITTGVAAMVASAGVDAAAAHQIATPLDANEVFQVTRATVSPIQTTPCTGCFPALAGAEWNLQYGYGRPNVYKAMKAVHDGVIPPTADITSPDWYDEIDPTRQSSLRLTADVAAKRTSGYHYALQYAVGPQPLDNAFHTIATGSGSTAKSVSGTIDLSQIPSSFWSGDYSAPTDDRLSIERYDITVRVVVTDDKGRVGEDRRVFQLRHDASELQQFHKNLGTSLESSPTMADIEGTGRLDTIVAGSDGTVHAFRPDGSEAPGWPVHTALARGVDPAYAHNYLGAPAWRSGTIPRPHEPIAAPAAVGDLDHDGRLWVVVTGEDGHVYAWDGAGRLRKGFPLATDRAFARQSVPPPDTPYVRNRSTGNVAGAALADLEGNGKLDIVMGGWDGRVYAWRPNGTPVPGWPVETNTPQSARQPAGTDIYARDYKVCTTPTIVDVDGDGHPDVVVALQDTAFGSQGAPVFGYVMGWSSKGTLLPHFPIEVPAAEQGYGTAQDFITEGVQTPASYDGPTGPHLVVNAGLSASVDVDLTTGVITHAEAPGTLPVDPGAPTTDPASPLVHFTTSPSLGHVGGLPAVVSVQSGSAATDVVTGVVELPGRGIRVRSGEAAWNPQTGLSLPQYTHPIQGLAFLSAPAIADVTGDGAPDILQPADSGAMHGWDGTTGQDAAGWPKWTGGWGLFTPAVGDIDGDGKVEVAEGTREGWLHVWKTPGLVSGDGEAWHWHQNDRNTGHYGDDTRPPAGVRDLAVHGTTLTFTSPGDDWNAGTPARYQVFGAKSPITQDTVARATALTSTGAVVAAGSTATLTVAAASHYRFVAVRAVDDAGNIGPLRVLGTHVVRGALGSSAPTGSLATTGLPGQLAPIALLLLVAGALTLRLRRSTG